MRNTINHVDNATRRMAYYQSVEGQKEVEKGNASIAKHTSKWNWQIYMGVASGTAFVVSTIGLIGCSASGCFGSNSNEFGSYCSSACSQAGWITAEVLSGVSSLAFCAINCCCKK